LGISENLATKGKLLLLTGQEQLTTIRVVFDSCLPLILCPSLTEFSVALNSSIYLGVTKDQYFGHGHRIWKFCPVVRKIIPIRIMLFRGGGLF
jgi:hypothetical protein